MKLRLIGALLASAILAVPAQAADPIKVVVPFAAGGPVDALARIVAAELSTRLSTNTTTARNCSLPSRYCSINGAH